MSLFGAMRLPRSVLFGSGQRQALAGVAEQFGHRVLICTDPRLGSDQEIQALIGNLGRRGLSALLYDQTQPDLPIDSIMDCVRAAASFTPDVVIGIGGGSCMDMAKAAAVLLTHGGEPSSYYGEYKVPGPVIPVIAVPTTSGTGSEVTPVAVVADTAKGMKIGIASPHIIPQVAVCDPELTLSCPPRLTACSGGDALTHAIESFTALARTPSADLTLQHVFIGKNALSDHFALLAISSIWNSLYPAYINGNDLQARENLMMGSLAAGCAFGTAGTAAAHAIQYPVGNATHTAHGDGVASLLPYVMEFNRPACVDNFAQIARMLRLGDGNSSNDDLSRILIDEVAGLLGSVGIPRTLKDLGLAADQQQWTAESAISIQRLVKNNPRPLDLRAMQAITAAAYSGDRAALRNA
ncbi:iron-containing alcohol dehydrogenase [Steroidobacter sp. S1-65]|uniref:Iron-containing alcohol dehydrogenase n=1 Tax=Steroidobacter gossypii TaxID=2805490 RepID=A0ABS1X099_9GAMM|nr:iron-containing alcohol dehydrogenase [Steroidobacter gossypii]MBM0106646.1 iron-containing alcohol dehydrogenase [Steroidobacter gossypii]